MSREVTLDGLKVTLGTPRQVLEAVGHCWFPNIARFASGSLMATGILTADSNSNLVDGYRVTGSRDGGQTWSRPYDVAGWGGGCISPMTSRPTSHSGERGESGSGPTSSAEMVLMRSRALGGSGASPSSTRCHWQRNRRLSSGSLIHTPRRR